MAAALTLRIYLQLYEQVLGEKAMAKRADVIAKADTPEVACLLCCLVQLAATRVTMAACLVAETHYYSLTVLAGHDGRDHARDYEQPPTGACSKEGHVSIKVPYATSITLKHSHTTAGSVRGRKCGRRADMAHHLGHVAAAGTCDGRLVACECLTTAR